MPSLRRRSDFEDLSKQGKFIHITHWLAVCYRKNKEQTLRWGWTVSKKVGNAVTRNRLKRWGREFVREFEKDELDINFIFKNKKQKGFYRNLTRQEFKEAFEKAFEKLR